MSYSSLLESAASSQWKKIGTHHHHGICLPIFSLHSKDSCGIGEFTDLLPLIPWCKDLGFDIIQVLPLNDTGPDSSPYGALSANALNPAHLGLSHLPHLEKFPELQKILPSLKELTRSQKINYHTLFQARKDFIERYCMQATSLFLDTQEYRSFINENSWVIPYSLFKSIKIQRCWQNWRDWPLDLRDPKGDLERLLKNYEVEISHHILVQFLCFQQLTQIKIEANTNKIFLKGDIPILINLESADVWYNRELFDLKFSAGAPPDIFSNEGQNWGFPLYNWQEMAQQNYEWWKTRLNVASRIYDIYRLDHIVGFFRIWAIPPGLSGKEGNFMPQNKIEWLKQGDTILRMMLENCPMLPIGEDLGTIPDEVRACMRSLGICGTKVMRWEKLWNEPQQPYIPLDKYIPESMTTVSTHDSETVPLWWERNPPEGKAYSLFKNWNFTYELTKAHQHEYLYDSHRTNSIFHINLLQEYLALIPYLSWLDTEDERINIPGVVSDKNWAYRFKPSVEEIVSNKPLYETIKNLIGAK